MRLAAALLIAISFPAWAEGRRYAIVVGANNGDSSDEVLHFAEGDARRMRDALIDVGGVRSEDVQLLLEPSAADVRQALGKVEDRLAKHASGQDQVVVYVSGHADSGDLHLNGTHLPLYVLTEYLKVSSAAVAILVVDSCRSGSAVRVKGLQPVEGPQVDLEVPDVTGRIIIGSSGADELSQESEALQGSVFTHHFVAGLRGAADASHDGVVTLEEAYDYAYALTVESTFATSGGVQHPSYAVDLRGQGQLVLSRPSQARGRLHLAVDAPGRWLIYGGRSNEIVAQIEKLQGPVTFALNPGTYNVLAREADGYREARVQIPQEGEAVVREADLSPTTDLGLAKGPSNSSVELGLDLVAGTGVTSSVGMADGFALWGGWRRPWAGPINLIEVELAGQVASTPSSAGAAYNEDTLDLRVGPGMSKRWDAVEAQLAVEAGWILVRQHLSDAPIQVGVEPEVGLSPRIQVGVGGPAFISLSGFGGVEWLRTETNIQPALRGDIRVGVGFDL